jgi:hypothetical protein
VLLLSDDRGSIGLRAEDLDHGHPAGEVTATRGRFTRFRNAR